MGEGNEICILHGELNQQLAAQNKDIGKVSERVGRVEEHTKLIPDILEKLDELQKEKSRSVGFVAGVSFVMTGIVSLIGWAISAWMQKGH